MIVSLQRYDWCLHCGRDKTVVYQGDCGCWTFKCLLCGAVDWAACTTIEDDHWAAFEELAQNC